MWYICRKFRLPAVSGLWRFRRCKKAYGGNQAINFFDLFTDYLIFYARYFNQKKQYSTFVFLNHFLIIIFQPFLSIGITDSYPQTGNMRENIFAKKRLISVFKGYC